MSDILFSEKDEIVIVSNSGQVRRKSAFIDNYIKNAEQVLRDAEWKQNGFGAKFTESAHEVPPEKYEREIRGIAALGGTVWYSAAVENSSGIFSFFSGGDQRAPEGHIIHGTNVEYGDLSVSADGNALITSIKDDPYSSNLTIFDKNNDYTAVTGGDSKDETPSFSKSKPHTVLYSTAGIGRNLDGDFVRYAPSCIAELNIDTRKISEIRADEKHSLIRPKDDAKGNIYFIERPSREKLKKPNIFLEILLIPFRLVYAIYKFLEAFTRIFTGKGFTTRTEGDNPSKSRSEREIVVDGYKIQAAKNLKYCEKRKEKFPGYAPFDWRLCKLAVDGTVSELARGVISYDVSADGKIVYTNGKAIIVLENGEKTKVADANLARRVAFSASASDSGATDPFGI